MRGPPCVQTPPSGHIKAILKAVARMQAAEMVASSQHPELIAFLQGLGGSHLQYAPQFAEQGFDTRQALMTLTEGQMASWDSPVSVHCTYLHSHNCSLTLLWCRELMQPSAGHQAVIMQAVFQLSCPELFAFLQGLGERYLQYAPQFAQQGFDTSQALMTLTEADIDAWDVKVRCIGTQQ